MQRGLPEQRRIAGVKKVIAVSSAKGGVGKSTIAANLALSFARQGHRTGILDTDVFGPSIPTLFNLRDTEEPRLDGENRLIPLTNYGVKTMSMGYLVKQESAIVWRGLILQKALQQLLHEVNWGGLDVLVLDLPPGTGDTQLTISQQIEVDGAILISTPQSLALSDTLRGLKMFELVKVPILGLVRNMSVFVCPTCNTTHNIFSPNEQQSISNEDGGASSHPSGIETISDAMDKHNIPILGDIPLDVSICRDADRGRPSVVSDPEGVAAMTFRRIAENVTGRLGLVS